MYPESPDRRYDSMESLLIDLRKALLNPNEDFVTLVPFNQDKTKTRVLTDDEVSQIRKQAENCESGAGKENYGTGSSGRR